MCALTRPSATLSRRERDLIPTFILRQSGSRHEREAPTFDDFFDGIKSIGMARRNKKLELRMSHSDLRERIEYVSSSPGIVLAAIQSGRHVARKFAKESSTLRLDAAASYFRLPNTVTFRGSRQ